MKVSSAFIRATQAHTVPKPDPWEKIPKSEWSSIYAQTNVAMAFKYKIWLWDSSIGEYVYEDVWRQYTFTNISQVKASKDNVYGQHLWSGDTDGMIPGVFSIDASRYYPTSDPYVVFDVRWTEGNGTMLDSPSFTLTAAGSSLYASGFTPGTYKMVITRYLGIPFGVYYNGQITRDLEVVGLRETHVSYSDDDWFDFDPTVQRFDGYEGDSSKYRRGLAVKITETHVFTIENLWQAKVFSSIGLGSFCDGLLEVDLDDNGERVERSQSTQSEVFHYQDFDLYRLK